MVNKEELKRDIFYESRIRENTEFGRFDHVYVDPEGNQWQATKIITTGNAGPTIKISHNYKVLVDKDGKGIPAPLDWDQGLPLLTGIGYPA
jgi:hypothetical protein